MVNLGVYVQVPFCQTKCTYCNFHTGVVSPRRFAPYIEAIQREISTHSGLYEASGIALPVELGSASLDTVYIGGGTPSLLDPGLLSDLLSTLRNSFSGEWREVTLEADPETIEFPKAKSWVTAGINRISFGCQSFVDEELKAAGRMHRSSDIYRAMPILREAGIFNISFDLIAGLPKQTHDSWRYSLAEAIVLAPEHISVYMMEIDEDSRLGLQVLNGGSRYSARDLPSEEAMAEFYEIAQAELRSAGYEQYEISNWSKRSFASQHNLKYWRREPYLGFGAGAHSFSGRHRWANIHDAARYVDAINSVTTAIQSVESVTPHSALQEEIFLGLRQLSGIDLSRIVRQYGANLEERAQRLASQGMLEREGSIVRLAPTKLNISNEVLVELLRD